MSKTIAIVGTHPMTRDLAPWNDPEIDIWVFNEAANNGRPNTNGREQWVKRADAVFQMHLPVIYKSKNNRADPWHWQWLQEEHPFPIYMLEEDPLVPSCVKYPFDEVCSMLPPLMQGYPELIKRDFFPTTIAYALALAVYKGYEKIDVYGVEMSSNTEYAYQKEGVVYWVGVAQGRGIPVNFYGGDALFNRPLYGFESLVDHRPETYQTRQAVLERQIADARKTKYHLDEEMEASWEDENLVDKVSALSKANFELGKLEGALEEIQKYRYKVEKMFEDEGMAYIDRNEFEATAAMSQPNIQNTAAEMHRVAGRIDYTMAAWIHTRNPGSLSQMKQFIKQHLEAAFNNGKWIGIFEENVRLLKEQDKLIMASGGMKAVEMIAEGVQ